MHRARRVSIASSESETDAMADWKAPRMSAPPSDPSLARSPVTAFAIWCPKREKHSEMNVRHTVSPTSGGKQPDGIFEHSRKYWAKKLSCGLGGFIGLLLAEGGQEIAVSGHSFDALDLLVRD